MRNTKALKILVILFAIILIMAMLMPTAFAASNLQSNPTTGSSLQKKYASEWMIPIRNMEQGYANSGASEELNADATSKTSNDIDVHMMKTTEYGAMAILSASEYGIGNKVTTTAQGNNSGSLTGNKTGVIIDTKVWECTASTAGDDFTVSDKKINEIYYNKYSVSEESARGGDALIDCMEWHNSAAGKWPQRSNGGILRGNGGLFSFGNYGYGGYYYYSPNHAGSGTWCARGVAVCGAGF